MRQKVIKPILLLIIAGVLSFITLHGYYPFMVGWFCALCSIPYAGRFAWPVIMYCLYQNAGILTVMKYGILLLSLGFCLGQYRSRAKKYNYIMASLLTLVFGFALEGMEWLMNQGDRNGLFFLIPIVVIEWSLSAIFTYLVRIFMWYIPIRTGYFAQMHQWQMKRTDEILKISKAFRDLALKIRTMSLMDTTRPELTDNIVEKEIRDGLCVGCENGQVQYMERVKLNYLWHNKMSEAREAMAIQLSEMAGILEYYTGQPENERQLFLGMENHLRKHLKEKTIIAKKINITKSQKDRIEVRLLAKTKRKARLKTQVMEQILSDVLEIAMRTSTNNPDEIATDFNEYIFYEDVNFHTLSAMTRKTRNDQEVSGDNYTYMELDGGQTFMSISDGMGSGEKARNYSETIIDLLEQLLESGFLEKTALQLINSVLITGNEWQEPVTLDMALIDKYSGMCQFVKMGAACTYIKRGNWVECIKSTSLPLGVFDKVDMETITKKLYDGDFVIMISDGIIEALNCPDKEEYMGRIIMDIDTVNPKEMALEILHRSLEITNGIPKDDMTVICTGIWDKET